MVKREKILVIEDEADLREVLSYNLAREGYRVVSAETATDGLRKARKDAPDLVLLDLMLPDLDGLEVCRRLKKDPVTAAVPVIMVTAKTEEADVVVGLGVGADDYIAKPFSPRTLVARVKAVLRRGPQRDEGGPRDRVTRGPLSIDAERHEARLDGELVRFTATEFRLVHFLAGHAGRVFMRDELMRRVMGEDVILVDRNVDVHIRAIRAKLGAHRDLVETVRGVGYRFRDDSVA
jgi:two-component system, OmpR family, alkaline phosphatase synthesis response regulator PhoP